MENSLDLFIYIYFSYHSILKWFQYGYYGIKRINSFISKIKCLCYIVLKKF